MSFSIYYILTLAFCSIAAVPLINPIADTNYNLPKDIVQVKQYEIHLTLSNSTLDGDLSFEGTAKIEITALKNTTIIPLHSKVVSIKSTKITKKSNPTDTQDVAINESDLNNVTDILTLKLNEELNEHDEYILEFNYIGQLSTEDMYGFYRSSYLNNNNDVVYLATTQFQPTHARRAFPCFDEPSFKAYFKISITHPKHLTALGNTLGKSTEEADGQNVLTEFELTPLMSTYLIAFIVSDFVCEKGAVELFGNVEQYVCSRPEAEESRKYALEITPLIVEELEKYTNIKYRQSGITKLHQVAIPDFAAGAMENWGLVTYRETALLWDEDVSNSYKQRVASVITHELAHQWFGNLVTTHWWSDTFLNEGFATFFETFTTALVEPTWDLEQQFVIDDVQLALNADSFLSSNALSHPASSPTEIMGRFGTISYSKGGSILRMIESILGKEQFKQGLQEYLRKTSFSMGTIQLLFENLQATTSAANLPSAVNLSTVLGNWIEKPGYPLLSVNESNNDLVISQTRFLLSGDVDPNEKWYVPISYAKSTDTNKFEDASPKNWLTPNGDLTVLNGNDAEWTILNVRETGFYRVDYSDTLLSKIKAGLMRTNFNNINEINRAQLVDDLFNLARTKKRHYSSVFEFISFLSKEISYPVWKTAFNSFSLIMQRTGDENIRQALSTLILQLMDTLYKSVPFEDHDDLDHVYTLKQVLAHNWACSLGHSDCRANAVDEFKKYINSTQKPPKNFRSIIYCNALRQSTDAQADWTFLWHEFHKTKSATEIVTIISSLGCVRNATILNEYLQLSITQNSGIRSQDALSVFSSVYSGSPEGVDIALNFLIEKHQEIQIYYNSMNAITSMFNGLANRIIKEDQITKLEEFANSNVAVNVKEAAVNALSTIRTNLEWTTFLEDQMREHFNLESPNSAIGATICITLFISVMVSHFLIN